MINQAGKELAAYPLIKAFEDSSLVIDGKQQKRDLLNKNPLLNGCSRTRGKYGEHSPYVEHNDSTTKKNSNTKERPFIKRLGSVALPDDLTEENLRNKRVKIEFTTRPTFRAPTLQDSMTADNHNDKIIQDKVHAKLKMIADLDFHKCLKETPQGQYFLIHEANKSRAGQQNHDSLAELGSAHQGIGHFNQQKGFLLKESKYLVLVL